jgi:hypothetical protein
MIRICRYAACLVAVLAAALGVAVDRLLSGRRASATRLGHRPARLGSDTAA